MIGSPPGPGMMAQMSARMIVGGRDESTSSCRLRLNHVVKISAMYLCYNESHSKSFPELHFGYREIDNVISGASPIM